MRFICRRSSIGGAFVLRVRIPSPALFFSFVRDFLFLCSNNTRGASLGRGTTIFLGPRGGCEFLTGKSTETEASNRANFREIKTLS